MLSGEESNTNLIGFCFDLIGLKPTIYHTLGEHTNHYTTDVVKNIYLFHKVQFVWSMIKQRIKGISLWNKIKSGQYLFSFGSITDSFISENYVIKRWFTFTKHKLRNSLINTGILRGRTGHQHKAKIYLFLHSLFSSIFYVKNQLRIVFFPSSYFFCSSVAILISSTQVFCIHP